METNTQGPCQFLTYTLKPDWVRDLEVMRDTAYQKADSRNEDPLGSIIRKEDLERAMQAIKKLSEPDRKFLTDILGLEGDEPLGLEEACEKRGIPLKKGGIKYKHLLRRLKQQLGE